MGKKTEYEKYAQARAKKSDIFGDCIRAFIVGGLICALGQTFFMLYKSMSVPDETVKILAPVTLIFLTALLTGIGIFDKIAKFGGAGTLVPITGFANAVVSPAIDNKNEGQVLGLGSKIFVISGPVILFGTAASVVYGGIYYICTVLM